MHEISIGSAAPSLRDAAEAAGVTGWGGLVVVVVAVDDDDDVVLSCPHSVFKVVLCSSEVDKLKLTLASLQEQGAHEKAQMEDTRS